MVANIRCNFFTDDGQGYCKKGNQCYFTHPDSPKWVSARRRGAPFVKRARSPARASSSAAWATDAWSGTPASQDASASTWAGFGSSSTESDSTWKGAWGSSNNSVTSAGWGDSSKPKENWSNNASSSGWGSTSTENDHGGWGGEGWSTGKTDKAGDNSTSVSSNQVASSGWESKLNKDMPSSGRSNPLAIDKEKPSSGPQKSKIQPSLPKPRNPDASSKQDHHSLIRLNTDMPPPPPPTRTPQGAATSAIPPSPVVPPSPAVPPSPVVPSPIIGSPTIIAPLQNSFVSREHSFKQIVESLVYITQIKVQHTEARNQHERWKHVTESKSFQRVRKSGGQRLNDIRAMYSTNARRLYRSVQENEARLAQLPDPLDSPRADIDIKKLTESMRAYKMEIFDYINAVERFRAAKAGSESEVQRHAEEAPIGSQLQTLTKRLQNLEVCMDDALVDLEDQIGSWDAENFLDKSQSIQDAKKNGDDKLSTVKAKLALLEEKFKAVDGRFNRHVADEEALVRKRTAQDKALDELRQQKAVNMKITAEVEELLKQAEVAQERRKAKINELSTVVRTLYTIHEAPRQAPVSSPPPLDNLIELLLQRDLVPLLDALMVEFKAALQRSEQFVQQKLQTKIDPILQTTQLILSQAKQSQTTQ